MNGKNEFRYDPLYRTIAETEEMRIIEGRFKSLFDRLKGIKNLGVIPEVFGMARYPKYEHGLGTIYQVNSLLRIAERVDENTIPNKYKRPLKLASLFLHLGHLPYTYSTERALLLASNLGYRSKDNETKKYVKKRIEKVLDKGKFKDERKESVLKNIFSLRDYSLLYRYFSGEILVGKWGGLRDKFDGLNDEDLEIIIKDLIDTRNDGYKYLNLADKADFVQRDALYFGTVRIDISPEHLYREISKYSPRFSVSEELLIDANFNYLTERFYDNSKVILFSRLYEKILASLIMSKHFNTKWLEDYDDDQFKRLICTNRDKHNKTARLPTTWITRAKDLFDNEIKFSKICELKRVSYPKEKNVIDIEYELIGKSESERGLVNYPFESGILVDVDYIRRDKFPPFDLGHIQVSINIFQNDSNKKFIELLKIIRNLSHYLSIRHVEIIREGVGNQLAWTEKTRLGNNVIINAIAEAIYSIENETEGNDSSFVKNFLENISSISTFSELWYNFENQFIWKEHTKHLIKEREKSVIYEVFTRGLLSLPVRLLQYKGPKEYLSDIHNILLQKISSEEISKEERGIFFEALCLVDKIRTRRGKFQFFLNGMVVIDPKKPKDQQDDNEFDVIELLINDKGKAECWIYACSVADDYKKENQEQLQKLADNINQVYPDLKICTRYIIPENKNGGSWKPKEEETGVGWN